MKEAKSVVYMPDTNILISWAKTYMPQFEESELRHKKNCLAMKDFCEENKNEIVVPDIVWVEFLSVMLHKAIDVNDDYQETKNRFYYQQSIVQQIEGRIQSSSNWKLNWVPEGNPFIDAQEILSDNDLIDEWTFEWMKKGAQNKRQKYTPEKTDRLTEKLLDGMDSAILIYLNELAHLEKNKDKRIVLYTADRPFSRISKQIKYHLKWFAKNITSVFALFDNVRCMKCSHDNDISILRENDMICQNKNRRKHTLQL